MKLNSLTRGTAKYKKALDALSATSAIPRLYLYADCIWAYARYGCVLNHYTEGRFYQRRFFERKRIFTYRRWKKVLRYNNPEYTYLLKDKIAFNRFFAKYIGREWLNMKEATLEEFASFVKKHHKIFVKPADGLEGAGCQLMDLTNTEDICDIYDVLKSKGALIEQLVIQHPEMVFGNHSVNTIRVYTIFDNKQQKAVCFKTTLRAGVGSSIVDNSHSGGVSYEIDITTGRISSTGWRHGQLEGVIIHPQTNICMLGKQIPFWHEVLNLCAESASMIPQVRYIGWDVAIIT